MGSKNGPDKGEDSSADDNPPPPEKVGAAPDQAEGTGRTESIGIANPNIVRVGANVGIDDVERPRNIRV